MSRSDHSLQPPAALEARVIRALSAEGLIHLEREKGDTVRVLHLRWATAAGVLLALGLFAGSWAARPAPDASDPRPAFALLLYEDAGYRHAPAEASEERIAEYAAWARELASEGWLVDGAKLSDSGTLLAPDAAALSLVPRAEEGVIAGYFVIRARDRAEAEQIARLCPHLKYGGRISLRQIEA